MNQMITGLFILLAFILCFMHDAVAIQPDSIYDKTPESYGLKYEAQALKSFDPLRLQYWIYPPQPDKDKVVTIILSYGDHGNMSYFITHAQNLSSKGCRAKTYDYRGFGKSDDFSYNKHNLYHDEYVLDLLSVIRFARNNYSGDKIALYGIDMGTIVSVMAAAQKGVDYMIAEAFVIDPLVVNERLIRLKGAETFVPTSAVTYPDKLEQLEIPILFFAGTGDDYTPVEESILAVTQHPERTLIVFRGKHMMGLNVLSGEFPGQEYVNYIDGFLTSHKKHSPSSQSQ